MKRTIPFLILGAIVVVFFRQFFLQNLFPIPADTIVGLYHPFRDYYAKDYPRGIPFKNFLITDPVRQQYPWRLESILQEKKWQLPLWNPYQFAGNPLLANQQSAVFMPFNLLFFILPFATAWSVLIVMQPLLAGVFLFLYLKNLKLPSLPSLLGSIIFIFSGFFVAWLEWGTVDMVAMVIPLGLLCIDKSFVTKKKIAWYAICLVVFVFAFFAGHVQTFAYVALLTTAYFILRFMESREKKTHLVLAVAVSFLFIVFVSVQLIPFMQFLLLSARESDLVRSAGWFFPYQHLVTFFVPDFFGNPTTLNYWGVWNYAELAGYVGIVGLFFAIYSLFIGKSKIVWFYFFTFIIAMFFALPTPIANFPLIFHIPFLSTAQPTRLMVLIDFSLSILAAFGFAEFLQNGKKIYIPLGIFSLIFMLIWGLVFFHTKLLPEVSGENIAIAKHNLLFPSGVFIGLFIFIFTAMFLKKKSVLLIVGVVVVALAVFDGIRFADKFTPFTNPEYLFLPTATTRFLQEESGIYRIMSTDSRILPPNFSTVYHVQNVDGYDPLYIKRYGELVAAMGRGKADIQEPFGFNRIITPQNINSRLINLLGVKYVLSLSDIQNKQFKKVFSEGHTQVYENTSVFPRAFFVKNITSVSSDQQSADFLFNPRNNLFTAAAVMGLDKYPRDLKTGKVKIKLYNDNSITIQTENNSDGFLVLTDNYYPTWHAYIDGKKTKIYITDLAFRGILVPKGKHLIKFVIHIF